jgi:hypothetical protein
MPKEEEKLLGSLTDEGKKYNTNIGIDEFAPSQSGKYTQGIDIDINKFHKAQEISKRPGLSPGSFVKTQDHFSQLNQEEERLENDQEARNQSLTDKVGNGLAKFGGRVATSVIGSTVGTLVGMLAWARDGEFKSFYDNEFQHGLDSVNDYIAENFEHHYSSRTDDWEISNFIFDKVFDGLGFATGAVLSGMIGGGIVGQIGKGVKFTKFMKAGAVKKLTGLKKAGASEDLINKATTNLIKKGTKANKLAQIPRTGTAMATGAVYESGFEARHAYNEIKESLISEYKEQQAELGIKFNPDDPELKRIEEISGRSANAVFAGNMALVGATQFVQFGKHLGLDYKTINRLFTSGAVGKVVGAKAAERAGKEVAEEIAKRTAKEGVELGAKKAIKSGSRNLRKATAILKNPVTESQEEMLQSVMSASGKDYALKKFKDDDTNVKEVLSSSIKAFKKVYSSKEGWEEGLIGAIIGSAGVVGPKTKKSGRKGAALLGGIKESYADFKADEARRDAIVQQVNDTDLASTLQSTAQHFKRQEALSEAEDYALENEDQFMYENAKDEGTFSYMHARKEAGMLDQVDSDIEELEKMPIEDFKSYFGIREDSKYTEANRSKEIASLKQKLNNIKESFDFVETHFSDVSDEAKIALAYNRANFQRLEDRKQSIGAEINELTGGHFTATRTPLNQLDETGERLTKKQVFAEVTSGKKIMNKVAYEKLYDDYVKINDRQQNFNEEWSAYANRAETIKLEAELKAEVKKKEKEITKKQKQKDKAEKRTARENNATEVAKDKSEQEELATSNKALEDKVVPSTEDNESTVQFTPEDTRQFIKNINTKATPTELAKFIEDSGEELKNLPKEIQDAYKAKVEKIQATSKKIAQQKSDPKGTDSNTEQTNSVRTTSEDSINEPTDVNVPPVKVNATDRIKLEGRIAESNKGNSIETNGVQKEGKGSYYIDGKPIDVADGVSSRTRDFTEIAGVIKDAEDTNNETAVPDIFFPDTVKEGDKVTVRLYEGATLGDKVNEKGTANQIMEVFITNSEGIEIPSGFIHDLEYITDKRVAESSSNYPDNIQRNIDVLTAFREKLYNELTKKEGTAAIEIERANEIKIAFEVEGKGLLLPSQTTDKGIERVNKVGSKYDGGTKVTAEFIPTDKNYKEGDVNVIIKQRKAEIRKDGKIIQSAEVVVMEFSSLEEGQKYIAENPVTVNPKRIAAINAKYDAQIDALDTEITGSATVPINSVGPGNILTKPNKKYDNKISDIIQDDSSPEIVVVKEGGLYIGNTPLEESRLAGKILNNFSEEDYLSLSGVTMIAVPAANGQYILSFVKNGTVSESEMNLAGYMTDVITAYVNQDVETLDSYGVQNSDSAVSDYIQTFIYTTSNTVKDGVKDKHYMFVGVNEKGVRSVQFESGGSIKKYNNTKEGSDNLKSLVDKIKNSLLSVDLNRITDKDSEIQLKDGEVLSYRDFMLDNLYVNFSSQKMTTSTGKQFKTYVANPIIHLDIEGTVSVGIKPSFKKQKKKAPSDTELFDLLNQDKDTVEKLGTQEEFIEAVDTKDKKAALEPTKQTSDVKVGVSDVFNENSELFNIGTEQLYSQYLDTVFLDSKVKDIVYHGGPININTFNISKEGNFFTEEKDVALAYSAMYEEGTNKESKTYSVLLNAKNPTIINEEINPVQIKRNKGNDSIIANKVKDVGGIGKQIVVFNPEQIHILGSKQDIKGFKEFVSKPTQNNKIKSVKGTTLHRLGKRGGKKSPAKFDKAKLLKGLPKVIDPKTNSLIPSKQNYDITKSMGYIIHSIVRADPKISVSEAFNIIKNDFALYRNNYLEYAKQEVISLEDTENGAESEPEDNAELAHSFTIVLDNFDTFKDNTKMYLSSRGLKVKNNKIAEIDNEYTEDQDIIDEAEADELNGETPDRVKQSYDGASFEENPINKLSSEVKVLLDSIPDENANILGLDTTHDLETVYNALLGIMANRISDTSEDTLELLRYNTENKPYISYIVEMLESEEMSQQDKNMFYSHFKKINKEFSFVLHEDDTYRVTNSNRNTVAKIIEKDWATNIIKVDAFKEENGTTVVNKEFVTGKMQTLWSAIEKDNYSVESTKAFLNSLGINISTEALDYLKENGNGVPGFNVSWEQLFTARQNGAFKAIKEKFEGTNKPDVHPLSTEGYFKKLAKLESRFRKDVSTASHLSAEGKSVFAFSNSTWFANRFEKLKDKAYVTRLLEVPFISHSRYLTKIKANNKNFIDNFNLRTLDSLVHKGKQNVKFASLSNREKLVTQISLFINSQQGGENKIGQFVVAKSDKGVLDILTAERHKTTNLSSKEEVHRGDMKVLLNIVKGEYARIKDAQTKHQKHFEKTGKNLFDDIEGYNPFRFYFFEGLNDILDISKEDELTDWDDMLNSDILIEVQEVLKTALFAEEAKTKEVLTEAEIIKNDKLVIADTEYIKDNTDNADFFVRDFVINGMIANAEYSMIFQGDVATAAKKTVEGSFDNMFKRLAKDIAPANRGAKHAGNNEFNQYRQIFLEDSKNGSLSMASYKELIPNDLAAYEEIEATDAQEVVLLSEHINVMYHEGRLEDEVYESLMKESKKPNPYYKDEDLKVLLNPHKPVHVGSYILSKYGVDLPVYIKTSSYPLIPQLIKGSEFEKLENLMRNHKDSEGKKPIARAVFKSGVKIGGYKLIKGWNRKLDSEGVETDITDGTFNEQVIKDALKDGAYLTLSRDNSGIQQDLPYDANKNAILEGSQLMKLIQAGIKNPKVLERLDKLHMGIVDKAYAKFLKRIEATENGTGFNQLTKLRELLIEELVERGDYTPNDLNALDLNEDKDEFLTPLWANTKSAQFESLLNSFISKKVLRQKLPGKSYNLGSEEGYKGRAQGIEYITEGLVGPVYNPAEGLRSQRIGYIKSGSKIEVEVYNDLTKEEQDKYTKTTFPAQILIANPLGLKQKQVVGYRIPTQDLNSMSAMEVVGYLPDYSADLAIASKDFIAQMGSDNDGDKIYIHRWYENKDGYKVNDDSANYAWNIYTEQRAKQKDILEQDTAVTKALSEEEFKEFFSKKIDQNEIMEIYYDTLMDIDNLPRILKPLGFGNLKDVAADITSDPHHPLSPIRQIDNYENGNAGKFGVSVTSLLSTGNALLNAAYKVTGRDIKVLIPGMRDYVLPNFKFNLNGKDYTDINSINDSEMTLDGSMTKADVISAFQSVSVDNIKELVINKINYNKHTHDALIALAYLGLTDTYIADVTKQPAIVEYVKIRENLSDFYSDEQGNPEEAAFENTKLKYKGNSVQLSNLEKFKKYSAAGKEIGKLIKAIQPASKGVGKNMVVSDIKLAKVNDILITEGLTNVDTVVGIINSNTDSFGNKVITPTTVAGQGVDILRKTNNLYSSLFEVNAQATKLAKAISLNRGTELSTLTEKERSGIVKFVKSYIYSADLKMYYGKDVNEYRQELLFGENTLAIRWNTFLEANPDHWLAERLNISTPKGSNKPHTVSYQASNADKTNDIHNTSTLIDMLLDNDNDVTRQLAIDTVAYTYLRGGNQDAHSLLKFLPNTYLQTVDMGGDAKTFVKQLIDNTIDNEILLEQYLQHYPYHADVSDQSIGAYTAVNTKDGWKLFNAYVRLDLLGTTDSVETQHNVRDARSFNKANQVERKVTEKSVKPITTKPNTVLASGVKNTNKDINSTAVKYNMASGNVSIVLDKIANTGLDKYKALAKALAPLTSDVSIKLADLTKEQADGLYNKFGITIDKNLKEDSKFQRVLLHEALHAVLNKVIDNPTSEQRKVLDSLTAVFNKAREKHSVFTRNVNNKVTGLLNMHEFISEIMTNSTFQKELSSIEFSKDKSFFDRLIELFNNIFSTSTGEQVTNAVMGEVLTLIDTVSNKQVGTKKNLDVIEGMSKDLDLDDEQDEFQSPAIVNTMKNDIFGKMSTSELNKRRKNC